MSRISDTYSEPSTENPERRTVEEIQGKVVKRSRRNVVSRLVHAKYDKEKITAWKLDLNRILHVFNVCAVIHMWIISHCPLADRACGKHQCGRFRCPPRCCEHHTMVSDMHRNMLKGLEGADNQHQSVSDICMLFRYWVNKWSRLSRLRPGQRS